MLCLEHKGFLGGSVDQPLDVQARIFSIAPAPRCLTSPHTFSHRPTLADAHLKRRAVVAVGSHHLGDLFLSPHRKAHLQRSTG